MVCFKMSSPAPFPEVAEHVDGMYPEHPQAVAGGRAVVVDYFRSREIYCLVMLVDAACQVDVLRIHEVSFVEEARFTEGIRAQQHEAAVMIWHIDRRGGVFKLMHFVTAAPATVEACRDEPVPEQVDGRGEWVAYRLERPVGIHRARYQLSAPRMRVHVADAFLESAFPEIYVGVDHEMICRSGCG